jgi:hypothetical protein
VGQAVERRRCDPQGHRDLAPEHGCAQVKVVYVDEHARPQAVVRPRIERVAERVLVPRSARVVRPCRRVEPFARRPLEVGKTDDPLELDGGIGRRRVTRFEGFGHRAQRSGSLVSRKARISR